MAKKIVPAETPTLNLITKAPYVHTDANLDLALQSLKPATVLKRMGFGKRSGDSIEAILYTLFLMPLLHLRSIYAFFDNGLSTLLKGGKDVVYDFMQNQSINWSLVTLKLALAFFNLRKWDRTTQGPSAFVVDDTLDRRRGRKVEATSLHWDHNLGKSIHGHQFLQLGFANAEGFLPLIGHLFVGKKKRSPQSKQFNDQRNATAKSYHDAHHLTKHQLLEKLLVKVLTFGFTGDYLLGDAWFGCRDNVKLALKHGLTAIFMMKRGKTKYRYGEKLYTAKGLYRKFRDQMTKVQGKSFHAHAATVDYNLSDDPKQPEWIQVQLVFSRMKSAPKSSWVVLLCTDLGMDLPEILEIYALRWNIEVYFKEIKQYFGFGKEQSWQYTVTLASIHLAMLRYMLFYYVSLVQGTCRFTELRNQISLNLKLFSYGMMVWCSISSIIEGVLEKYTSYSDEMLMGILKAEIEDRVSQYFESLFPIALGIRPEDVRKLDCSEKKGAL
jgi:hypothetical protein